MPVFSYVESKAETNTVKHKQNEQNKHEVSKQQFFAHINPGFVQVTAIVRNVQVKVVRVIC